MSITTDNAVVSDTNTTIVHTKGSRPDTAARKVSHKSKEATASVVTTGLILRILAFVYGINHVHIQHRRETVLKLVPHVGENGQKVYSTENGPLFVFKKQFRGNGGRTTASVTLADGRRFEGVAITNNQSKFVKRVGYNQAVLNLFNNMQADDSVAAQFTPATQTPPIVVIPTSASYPSATQA